MTEYSKGHEQKTLAPFKVFDLYDTSEIVVEDLGLKNVINLEPKLILKSHLIGVHR